MGDTDQEIFEQRLAFLRVLSHEPGVAREVRDIVDAQSSGDAPQDGRVLVVGEVVPGAASELYEDVAQRLAVRRAPPDRLLRNMDRSQALLVRDDPDRYLRHR